MLGVLDLFDEHSTGWSFEQLHQKLGYTRSTLYRYLKALTDAGLLTSLPGMGYTLGPRIIELDYQIRVSDPLIRAARPTMQELVSRFAGVALLCRRYRQKVLCVHQETSTAGVSSNYERGRARPLLRGAASLVILAHLPSHRIASVFSAKPAEFAEAQLGSTLAELKANLKAVRQAGWVATTGQVQAGVTGIAAPLFDARQEVLGSLSLTVSGSVSPQRTEEIAQQVTFCSRIISKSLAH